MELRKVRGPILDTFYARLRRCSNPACTGRPFTEHRAFPGVVIEPGGSRSAWRQAAAIREAIASGRIAAGQQLPSARELAAQHGLPVSALRRALEGLATEGVIAARQGRRSVVADGPGPVPVPHPRADDTGHDCARAGCQPHRCRPMSAMTIRHIHAILSVVHEQPCGPHAMEPRLGQPQGGRGGRGRRGGPQRQIPAPLHREPAAGWRHRPAQHSRTPGPWRWWRPYCATAAGTPGQRCR
jgi:GntR family transcriptional regulator